MSYLKFFRTEISQKYDVDVCLGHWPLPSSFCQHKLWMSPNMVLAMGSMTFKTLCTFGTAYRPTAANHNLWGEPWWVSSAFWNQKECLFLAVIRTYSKWRFPNLCHGSLDLSEISKFLHWQRLKVESVVK